jgi:peptidyl-prolyl cis-trans isomerase B (cyclophilin B)
MWAGGYHRRVTSLRRFSLLFVIPLLALTAACGSDETTTPKAKSSECAYNEDGTEPAKQVDPPPGNPAKDSATEVTIATNRGDVKVSLDADKAPCTVNSFLSLAKQGYFDDTPCHRLTVEGLFVLQCGDPSGTGAQGPGYAFDDELVQNDPRIQPCQTDAASAQDVCTYTTGTVAMANAGPGTNGSQFFLVYKDSPLPAAYTVFGRMSAAGVKTVQKIAAAGAEAPDPTSGNTAPKLTTTITSVK